MCKGCVKYFSLCGQSVTGGDHSVSHWLEPTNRELCEMNLILLPYLVQIFKI
jgi:hypothetical protein